MVVARPGEEEQRELVLNGDRVSVEEDDKFLEIDG